MQILIKPTIDEVYSESFSATDNNNLTLICNGLQGNEFATLQIYDIITKKYYDWLVAGKPQQMNGQNNVLEIFLSQGTFRIHKSVTLAPIGVVLCNTGV